MPEKLEQKVRFDIIRYANVWEDADILLEALNIQKEGIYLSIASSGDNALSMLSCNPKKVLAVDLSPAQIACTEIRKTVFKKFPYDKVLSFLGVSDYSNRLSLYNEVKNNLTKETRDFWDMNQHLIAKGIIHSGKFERYFRMFRKWILPLIHGRKKIDTLLQEKDTASQKAFYKQKWNTWRWRLLFKLFFSRFAMGRLGRDPEFFKYVEGDVAQRIMGRAEYALTKLPTYSNPYLRFILKGNFESSLPFYLREDNFEAIKSNIDTLELRRCSIREALSSTDCLFNGFNLSDIFEYMSNDEYIEELQSVLKHAHQGARIVYWNMLADRLRPESLSDKISPLTELSKELFSKDKAFFYKALIVEETV
jgi:S-adenosylmethionine-diacylglycerol 3-amino-3-carboxypropyl transferase